MTRRINPVLIINGIFLVVMMLLFARFVNTGALFREPSAMEKLTHQLKGDFITPDSADTLAVIEATPDGKHEDGQPIHTLQFTAAPALPFPWENDWTFQISAFGPLEILAEGFDLEGNRWTGCEMVFVPENEDFVGEIIGAMCGVDSLGHPLTLRLRTAADSLIFATHRKLRNGGKDFSREFLFLRRQSTTN